jgi:hypothetical protein
MCLIFLNNNDENTANALAGGFKVKLNRDIVSRQSVSRQSTVSPSVVHCYCSTHRERRKITSPFFLAEPAFNTFQNVKWGSYFSLNP